MEQMTNRTVGELTEELLRQLRENGYSQRLANKTMNLAKQLEAFMEENALAVYNADAGFRFQDEYIQKHISAMQQADVKIFVARLNGVYRNEDFIACRKRAVPAILPDGLETLLTKYRVHCAENGYRLSSIQLYEKVCRRFLKALADEGVSNGADVTVSAVSKAILRMKSPYYLSAVHTFLVYLAESGSLDQDYSSIVPPYKRPQPMPSVYSVEEVQRLEAAVERDASYGKRDYAVLLLAARLGIRAGDIATMTFDELDFETNKIRITQQKTDVALELPMLPVIRNALLDYIQNARGSSDSPYVFLSLSPPYSHISVQRIGKLVRSVIKKAGIDPGHRKMGPHALRSSIASSMVNDCVPYEVVRRMLGHTDKNAIKSYARLDVEQLKSYTLETPAATGCFADFLSGGCKE